MDEVGQGVESRAVTDLRDRERRVAQELGCVTDPEADQVPVRRHAVPLFEDAGEVERRERRARATAFMSRSWWKFWSR